MCLPQLIKSFQNYRGVATTFYPTLVFEETDYQNWSVCFNKNSKVCVNLRERDTVTNLEFDLKGVTDEEEMLQAESEHDGSAEQEQRTPASAKNKFKNKIFQGTHPRYQPETAFAVLMKYLVESDKERQAGQPVDPTDAFFKSIAATVKTFSPYYKTFASQEYLRLYLK
jgi:hypothetical protein